MHCYKLTISYDGTHYSGWQIQPNASSIQQHLQEAIRKALHDESIKIIGSGRTDAGVHAIAQVAHFKSKDPIDQNRLLWALNGILPKDIRVKNIQEVSPNFHSQYSALSKEYHYHIHLGQVISPFQRLYSWHVYRKLDLPLLKETAALFIGTHDFTSFANESQTGSASVNPIRTLYRLDVLINEDDIRLEFEGNGFLYKMVRNIVGTLVAVASNLLPYEEVISIFEAKDRRRASQAAPPKGLFLVKVNYPSNDLQSLPRLNPGSPL